MAPRQIEDLVDALKQSRISRREFLVRAAGLGLSLSAIGTILAACGSETAPAATSAPAAATSAPAEPPATTPPAAPTTAPTVAPQTSKAPYKLGVAFSLTGSLGSLGIPCLDGMKVALDELNKGGGVNGHPIELVIEDDQSKPDVTVTAANKLIFQDKVMAIIGGNFGSSALALSPITEKNKIPTITPTGYVNDQQKSYTYTFLFLSTMGDIVRKILEVATQDLKLKKVAMMRLSREYGQVASKALASMKDEFGVEVVAEEQGTDSDTDFTAQLTNIRAASPEVLIDWFSPPAGAIIMKNAKQLGLDVPILAAHSLATKQTIDVAGEAMEGVIVMSYIAGDDPLPRQQHFVDTWKAAKGGEMIEMYNAVGYDIINFMAKALGQVGDGEVDPAKLRQAMEDLKYEGAGIITDFKPDWHDISPKSILALTVKNGKFALFKR